MKRNMKRYFTGRIVFILLIALSVGLLSSCADKDRDSQKQEGQTQEETQRLITVGFSQLGAESDWRSANTKSMKETFSRENGYELVFEDGQQKQQNQIMAIRTFIQQDVDYIVLAPVTETGWETVLSEAKNAKIPVIIVDRMVNVTDQSLFTAWVGSDFELEGRKVTAWLNSYLTAKEVDPSEVHIVSIQGNLGASAQIGRTNGLLSAVEEYGWDLLDARPGDFTQTKGKEVMEAYLKEYENLNVVYCENDNEALGAIEAIEEAGRVCGPDIRNGEIIVLSFDGVNKNAVSCVLEDKIMCIGECNPILGPRVDTIIKQLEEGLHPDKLSYVDEDVYSHDKTIDCVEINGKKYTITNIEDSEIRQ